MNLPEYCICDFLIGRFTRLAPSLTDVYVKELVRFTDDCANFVKLFPLQDQLIATLFHEQQLNPMLKAYKEAQELLTSYRDSCTANHKKRTNLQELSANGLSKDLANLVCEIRALEEKQNNLLNTFYTKCNALYPPNIIINNATTFYNNIQHN